MRVEDEGLPVDLMEQRAVRAQVLQMLVVQGMLFMNSLIWSTMLDVVTIC
jgi:hypothetical protein